MKFVLAALVLAVSSAQAQEPKPTHFFESPVFTLVRFDGSHGCRVAEFRVVYVTKADGKVSLGCGHQWGETDFFEFEDGEWLALSRGKWKEYRPGKTS